MSVGINRVSGSIWVPKQTLLPTQTKTPDTTHREAARELTSPAIEVGPWANAMNCRKDSMETLRART